MNLRTPICIPRLLVTLAAIVAATLASPDVLAQTVYNRHVETIALTPNPAGGHDVHVVWGVNADNPHTTLDLSTEMTLLINGATAQSVPLVISASPAGGSCGPNSGFCQTNQSCICCEIGGEVICSCGGFITTSTGGVPAQPGDVIEVILRPLPGALPEQDTNDDAFFHVHDGNSIDWNRRVKSVEVIPSSTPGRFRVRSEVEVQADNVPTEEVAFYYNHIVSVNGVAVQTTAVNLTAHTNGPGNPCGGCPLGQLCYCDDDICQCDAYFAVEEVEIPLVPGDIVEVTLVPLPGALPELPGFGDDDEQAQPAPGTCRGDCSPDNGNGFFGNYVVNFDDLIAVINGISTQDLNCDVAPDNGNGTWGNGVINIDDVLAVIAAFGDCPVIQ